MPKASEIEHRRKYIADLRAAADFIEAHPEIPTPFGASLGWVGYGEEALTAVRAFVAAATGKIEKSFDQAQAWVWWGDNSTVKFHYGCPRDLVCERVVVETQVIPAHVIPAKEVAEEVKEIVEWRCRPLLSEAEEAQIGGAK